MWKYFTELLKSYQNDSHSFFWEFFFFSWHHPEIDDELSLFAGKHFLSFGITLYFTKFMELLRDQINENILATGYDDIRNTLTFVLYLFYGDIIVYFRRWKQ